MNQISLFKISYLTLFLCPEFKTCIAEKLKMAKIKLFKSGSRNFKLIRIKSVYKFSIFYMEILFSSYLIQIFNFRIIIFVLTQNVFQTCGIFIFITKISHIIKICGFWRRRIKKNIPVFCKIENPIPEHGCQLIYN